MEPLDIEHQPGLLHVRLGQPDLPVDLQLLEQLAEHLRSAMREIIRERVGESRVQVRLLVREVSKGSIILAVEPELIGDDLPSGSEVARTLIDDINGLSTDHARSTIGSNLLRQYRSLVEIGSRAGRLQLGFDDASSEVGPHNEIAFEAAMREMPEPDTQAVGIIETVNIHTRPWNFGLYTKLDRQRVECRFPDSMLDQVLLLMQTKSLVEVTGEAKFAPVGVTPRLIELTDAPRPLAFDPHLLLSYRRSAEIIREGESAADALLRVREESAGFG